MKSMDADLCHKQFVLSSESTAIPRSWKTRELSGWILATHPTQPLPILNLHDRAGTPVGWLIGTVLTPTGEWVEERFTLPFGAAEPGFFARFESELYALAGRYAAVVLSDSGARFYLDPGGTLAAVYSLERPVIASSLGLIPASHPGRDADRELIEALDIPAKDHWYPFGLTARASVRRILPNHGIDLAEWKVFRHWPGDEFFHLTDLEIGPAVDQLGAVVERIIRSAALARPSSMNLTAGRDSRILLACSRQVADRLEFNTTELPDNTARTDCQIARKIARRFRLRHTVHPWLESSQEELELWQQRTGYCVAGRSWRGARTFRENQLAGGIGMGGLMAEVGRSYYWREADLNDNGCLDPAVLVSRLDVPPLERFIRCCAEWAAGIPVQDRFLVLDLLYLEQRVGCWAGPQLYGHVGPSDPVFPFNHRTVMATMIHLPPAYKFDQRLTVDLIQSRWPELLRFPFNPRSRLSKIRSVLGKMRRQLFHRERAGKSLTALTGT